MAAAKLVDECLLSRLAAAEAQGLEPAPDLGVGVRDEPVGCFHDVRVGVVNDAVFDVRHERLREIRRTLARSREVVCSEPRRCLGRLAFGALTDSPGLL
jgi:hypothetical protein